MIDMKMNNIMKVFLAISVTGLIAVSSVWAASGNGYGNAKKAKLTPKVSKWYLKTMIMVEDGEELIIDDRSGVFGRINGGLKGKDIHDIPVFQSVSGSPGAVVFVKDELAFGDDEGQYLSDYRKPGKGKQRWDFTVYSTRTEATVTIFWDGFFVISKGEEDSFNTRRDDLNKVYRSLRLVDLDTGKVVSRGIDKVGRAGSYTFSMDGNRERNFRWVQGNVKAKDLKSNLATNSIDAGVSLESLRAAETAAKDSGGLFGPPPSTGSHSAREELEKFNSRKIER